jgi:hypothetical protein
VRERATDDCYSSEGGSAAMRVPATGHGFAANEISMARADAQLEGSPRRSAGLVALLTRVDHPAPTQTDSTRFATHSREHPAADEQRSIAVALMNRGRGPT